MTPAHVEPFDSTIMKNASCASDRAESTQFGETDGCCDHES
jgi:hypothetical protein